jgi:hypothetical protein
MDCVTFFDARPKETTVMAWKWYEIESYKASVGGTIYYGGVQLFGQGFYALLTFHRDGPLPDASAPTTYGQRFYGHLDFVQMQAIVDLLRNESPISFGWSDQNLNHFHLMTGTEPVGEGDGLLADEVN